MENQPHREPATPEEIWKILRAVSEEQKELSRKMKETDRQIQETNREIAERQRETDRQMKETDWQLKKTDAHFNSQWGKLMESLVEGDLVPLLQARE